jgi:hypothetical protein
VAEWLAPRGIARLGIEPDKLKKGDRVVLTGNPHREIAGNGILNFKSVTRPGRLELGDAWASALVPRPNGRALSSSWVFRTAPTARPGTLITAPWSRH